MPQTTYDKNIIIVLKVFSSKLLSSFSLSAICSFLKYLRSRPQAVVTVKIYNPGSDLLGATQFLTHCDPCFGNHCFMTIWYSNEVVAFSQNVLTVTKVKPSNTLRLYTV